MTEVAKRSSSVTEPKKDPFRYVPDIIEEKSREDGMTINRYTKGIVLGRVRYTQSQRLSMNYAPPSDPSSTIFEKHV